MTFPACSDRRFGSRVRWPHPNAQPALAALYAQINHFNPSAYRITPEAWHRALGRLNEPQSLTRVLADMERRGYIERAPSPSDRRKVLLSVTPVGVRALRHDLVRQPAPARRAGLTWPRLPAAAW